MEDTILKQLAEIRQQVEQLVERVRPSLPLTLKREEAAKLLSVSPSTLKGMIKRGEIVPTKVSGRQMIPSSEVVRIAGVRPPAQVLKMPERKRRVRGTSEGEKIRSRLAATKAKRRR